MINLFTATQIARAAGITRQAVHAGLLSIASAGLVRSQGTQAAGWRFSDLPLDWQLEITRRRVKQGFENGEQFLANLPEPWKCPLAFDQVPQHQRNRAVKLQKALARALAMRGKGRAADIRVKRADDPRVERADDAQVERADDPQVERAALEDFKAEFGYLISGRHWRRLLHRTIERDGGEENWQRLEIYLDERAFAAPATKPEAVRNEFQHQELDEVIATLENRQHPTPEDRQFLWDAAFRHYEQATEQLPDSPDGKRERRIFKASLAHYLFKAFPERTLCATEASLRRRFDDKLDLWRQKGRTPEALQDRRALDSGNFRRPDFTEDLKKIRDLAIKLDGSEALAHRMLYERGELSKEFCDYYSYDVRRHKSAVPKAVRDAITPQVDMCLPLRRGPWQARMRGPYIPRDWSGVRPGNFFSADDTNLNHYWRERLPDGRETVIRGEFLLMTDLATGNPLECLMIPGSYHGEHCKTLSLKVHDKVGLPREGYYFERGRWASKIVAGEGGKGTRLHRRETENGLAALGLRIEVRHATTPRAKPIEGLLHILQDRMRCIQNFVGFNERTEEFERVQVLLARARRGDPEALAQFPTGEEWMAKIREVLKEFAHDPQNGKMLEGRSPAEAWTAEISHRPLSQLPEEARYILSTHQKKVTVRQQGIVLTIRGKRLLYYNEHTGPLIGQEVLAFYNSKCRNC